MRNLRGIIVTGIFAALTLALRILAERFDVLMGMAYPFFSKTIVEVMATWTGKMDFCFWQVALMAYLGVVIVTFALMILFRWNFLRWLGAVLAPVSVTVFLFSALWGLNYYNKPLNEAIRMNVGDYTITDLQETANYYRQEADKLASQVERDEAGDLVLPSMEEMNQIVSKSYDNLVWDYSIFAGPHGPVKELGWSDRMSAMGIDGITVGITGEAAVNMNQYEATIPYEMCQQVACLLAFPREGEGRFAAYLACEHSDNVTFRYCGYLNAFLECSNVLYETSETAWNAVWEGTSSELRHDVEEMNAYSAQWEGKEKKQVQGTYDELLNKAELEEDTSVYHSASNLLVAWYVQNYRPVDEVEENPFDPTDYYQVFPQETTEATEETTGEG